ncbi:MAG TPA: amino acid adenylation domain-containing protein [Pyrinomonadaceae bacterium]|jgi:amino acid adenylation domain-containing protein
MSEAAKNVTELSPEERAALVARLKRRKAAEASAAPAARPPAEEAPAAAPLSYAQQRLWFLEQLEPNSPYKMPVMFRLAGRLDAGALEQSLNEIVARHESLRTTFDVIEGRPVQLARPRLTLALPFKDLSGLSPDEQAAELKSVRARACERPFDLVRGPLVSAALMRLSEEEHVLLFLTHHIVSDGWSLGVIAGELCAYYEAFAAGRRPQLPPPPIQYRDFAVWQREHLSGEVLERQLEYWRGRLGGGLPTLELPTDWPRPPVQSYRGALHTRLVGRGLTGRLKELSRREGVTLYMTLLAAFDVLLHRYTGQADIVVGTPIAGRNRVEVERLVGFFVNTLVLRADLSADPPFKGLLRRVRETTLGAYAHQDVPFERLVEELQPERDTSRTPLFQVMFSLQNGPAPAAEAGGLRVSMLEDDAPWSLFDLSLDVTERADGLACGLEYNTDLFEGATAERMLAHFAALLDSIAREPEARLSELPLLTGEERRRLLVEWNDTARDFPRDKCVHELFEAQAARTPDAAALVAGVERLTYAELDARAERLARRLRAAGVGPEARVGVLVGRGAAAAVALLGVLKAGGAYVAFDATCPAQRLRFMLEDSGARVLLTERRLAPADNPPGVNVVLAEGGGPEERLAEGAAARRAAPDNLAYVVYTSGTTGRPKGVLVTHRSLVNTGLAFAASHRLTPRDRVLQFASLSFDVSSEEFFAAWLAGACAVMRPEGAFETVEEFTRFVEREGVTLVNLPASFWAEWVATLEERAGGGAGQGAPLTDGLLPPALRRVVVGNEKTLSETLGRWRRLVGDRVGWCNAYGPTEATVTASNYEPEPAGGGGEPSGARGGAVPIGRPIMNAELHVLDPSGGLVPVGVVGELFVGGEGVARGYQGKPALTAGRFTPHPYARRPGERLYRTGDVARRLADGQVEFLGRTDEQVKVRGFRVELSEIESALAQHPDVRESVAAALDDGRGPVRLAAYVVTRGGDVPGDLREFLRERLPEYMIPSAFVRLEELPLNANGKLDRKALPAPSDAPGAAREAYVAPRSELERTIAGVWQEVLKVERVGVHDNFFGLGGHSLSLLHVNSRLRAALRSELPVIEMFKYPTVGALAAHLSGASAGAPAHGSEAGLSAAERVALLGRRRALRRRGARTGEAAGAGDA